MVATCSTIAHRAFRIACFQRSPILEACLKQVEGADDIRLDELARAVNGAVHVALGGKVHDGIRLVLAEHFCKPCSIAEIDLFENIIWITCQMRQFSHRAGVNRVTYWEFLMTTQRPPEGCEIYFPGLSGPSARDCKNTQNLKF